MKMICVCVFYRPEICENVQLLISKPPERRISPHILCLEYYCSS